MKLAGSEFNLWLLLALGFVVVATVSALPNQLASNKPQKTKTRTKGAGSDSNRVQQQQSTRDGPERYDETVDQYLTERTCWWNEMCKEEFSSKFRCRCPLWSFCSSPGRYYNAHCSMSGTGYLWQQPRGPPGGNPFKAPYRMTREKRSLRDYLINP